MAAPRRQVWETRISGARAAYADSVTRLGGALEDLERSLCALTGDDFRHDEPLLHVRSHLQARLVH